MTELPINLPFWAYLATIAAGAILFIFPWINGTLKVSNILRSSVKVLAAFLIVLIYILAMLKMGWGDL